MKPAIFKRRIVTLMVLVFAVSFESAESAETFRRSSLSIFTKSSERFFTVEIAKTQAQRSQGLQGRKMLAPGKGMLFDFQSEQIVTMWMKNTYISLDMIFIAADGSIVNIARGTTPQSLKHISSEGPVRGVLEVQAGTTKVLGINKGDRVKHEIFNKL